MPWVVFAVSAQALAVVRGHDHGGVAVNFLLLERGDEFAHGCVGRSDRRIVGSRCGARVVDVNPQKERVELEPARCDQAR